MMLPWTTTTASGPSGCGCVLGGSRTPPSTVGSGRSATSGCRRVDAVTPDGHPTLAELEHRIRTDERTPAPGLFVVELGATAEPVGYCGLVANSVGVPQEPELAFEFLRASWGQGFATEAARVIVDDAAARGYGHLAATVRAWNAASLHVLDKLGFVDTGVREPDPVHGDSLLLRLRL